ncbi:MAG: alpha/beta hydrolase [Actinomycetota bacterium]|nr:alpha/beta hydrolase [Actinomycetota bacterium]MDQ6948979.1 alpha/beta hydrolase [Actinomycetota bacterium]
MAITEREQRDLEKANDSGRQPVVFVHGLWLLASSWDRWRPLFEERGYTTLAPGWPDDPETVAEAHQHPEVFAGKSIGQITAHFAEIIKQLGRQPVVIGHSFGGLITQKLAGDGLAAGAVAIDPAPFRGVLSLPLSSLKASFPVLSNPRNRSRAVALTFEQFQYSFVNVVPESEGRELYQTFAVPGPGVPLFQAAFANINPRTEASVHTANPQRGPLLIISGEKDHTVPPAIAQASYRRYKQPAAPTEITEIPNRGHSLVIDSGWPAVAEAALAFLDRHNIRT